MIRWMNIALFLAALYGAYLAVREEQLNRKLSVQHRTLAAETGARRRTSGRAADSGPSGPDAGTRRRRRPR